MHRYHKCCEDIQAAIAVQLIAVAPVPEHCIVNVRHPLCSAVKPAYSGTQHISQAIQQDWDIQAHGILCELMLVLALQLSWGNPVAAVCSRGDLEGPNAVATGCFDTKVTSYSMALQLQVDAVAGPTTQVCSLFLSPCTETMARRNHTRGRDAPVVTEYLIQCNVPSVRARTLSPYACCRVHPKCFVW